MFILARRIAGALLVFGILYFFAHGMVDSRSPMPPPVTSWGAFPFMAWLLTFGMAGIALLFGKSAPGWFGFISIFMFLGTCMAWFGTVPLFLDHIHDERSFWLAYLFNVVPIAQFMSLAVLGWQHEPGTYGFEARLGSIPAE